MRKEEWNIRDVVTVKQTTGFCRIRFLSFKKRVDGLDILGHGHNATCEDKQACDDGKNANDIQANEYV